MKKMERNVRKVMKNERKLKLSFNSDIFRMQTASLPKSQPLKTQLPPVTFLLVFKKIFFVILLP